MTCRWPIKLSNYLIDLLEFRRPSVRPSVRLSVRPFVRPSIRPSVRPSVRTSVHKKFSDYDFDLIWCVDLDRICAPSMTPRLEPIQGQDQGHWVSEVPKIALFKSISSAILAWSSKLMVDYDSVVYSLSLPDFWIPFSVSYHVTSHFAECWYYRTFKGPYFCIAWG